MASNQDPNEAEVLGLDPTPVHVSKVDDHLIGWFQHTSDQLNAAATPFFGTSVPTRATMCLFYRPGVGSQVTDLETAATWEGAFPYIVPTDRIAEYEAMIVAYFADWLTNGQGGAI